MPRMITIKEAVLETGLSYDYLRNLCLENKIVYVKSGSKYFINADKLAEYLNGGGGNDR